MHFWGISCYERIGQRRACRTEWVAGGVSFAEMGNPWREAGCCLFAKISVFATVVVVVSGGGSSVRFISCFGYYLWGAYEVSSRGAYIWGSGTQEKLWTKVRKHRAKDESLKKLWGDEERPRSSQKTWKNWTDKKHREYELTEVKRWEHFKEEDSQ